MDKPEFLIEVPADADGQRLDQFLAQQFPELSRSRWVKLCDAGAVWVENRAANPALRLKAGQKLQRLKMPGEEAAASGPDARVVFRAEEPTVLFEDADIAVINKPCGLTVHPGAGVPLEETLAGWLLATGRVDARGAATEGSEEDFEEWSEEVLEDRRPGIVHRLDRGTSGALVVAKNPFAHAALARQFADREAGRLYWAVVDGPLAKIIDRRAAQLSKRPSKVDELLATAPCPVALRIHGAELAHDKVVSFASRLERDPRDRVRFRVSPNANGKRAVTHIAEVSDNGTLSLLECKLETGRTHQIRVHLSTLGLPILGDALYGGREHTRMWLHAHSLNLRHPRTGEELAFKAPWPVNDMTWLAAERLPFKSRGDLWKELKSNSDRDGHED